MTWEAMIAAARSWGYAGPDTPVTDEDVLELARSLALAAKADTAWEGIVVGSAEYVGLVMAGRIEIDTGEASA